MNIILNPPKETNQHLLVCKKQKGSFVKDQRSLCLIQPMSDGRLMIMTKHFGEIGYTCCDNIDDANKHFDEVV